MSQIQEWFWPAGDFELQYSFAPRRRFSREHESFTSAFSTEYCRKVIRFLFDAASLLVRVTGTRQEAYGTGSLRD
jgi:hypothetical protein